MKNMQNGSDYTTEAVGPGSLGVRREGDMVTFTVAVPAEKSCELLLYRKEKPGIEAVIPMPALPLYGDMRSVRVKPLPLEQYEYNYRIDGEIRPDPAARYLTGTAAFGSGETKAGSVRSGGWTAPFDWGDDKPLLLPYEDCVLYAAHVRGLTMHESSGVRFKGTFQGVREKIPYLKKLGINQLELMPVYEFEEVKPREEVRMSVRESLCQKGDRVNYWGYGTACYFAPKRTYAAGGDPAWELKSLVRELHRNGIELILEFYFPARTDPNLITECLRFWVREYHIDGFHVNREGVPLRTLAMDPLLSRTKLMAEGFPMEEIYDSNEIPVFRKLAEYHGGFGTAARRFLKGDEGVLSWFAEMARRNGEKNGVINYICCHDGFTLADLVSYEEKHNEANGEDNRDGTSYNFSWNCGAEGAAVSRKIQKLRRQQCRNALALVMLSQGTPMLYSGDEMGNSQQGNNNAYCQDNETGWVCWNNGKAGRELQKYVRKLIAFRKEHPVLRQKAPLQFADPLACGYPDLSYHGTRAWYGGFEPGCRHLGMLYAGAYAGVRDGSRQDCFCYAAYNMHGISHVLALPLLPKDQKWYAALDTGREEEQGFYPKGEELLLKEQRTVEVPAHTILVLIGK